MGKCFSKTEFRTAHDFINCDCSHIVAPHSEYMYHIGTIDGVFDSHRYCQQCEPTPETWWARYGITEATKPDFLVEFWNQNVQIGDPIGFIQLKTTRKRSLHGEGRMRTRNQKLWIKTKTTTNAMVGSRNVGDTKVFVPIIGIEYDSAVLYLRSVRPL